MHSVLILTRNNLALTKRAIESVYKQRIKVDLYVIENGSSDGTHDFLRQVGIGHRRNEFNAGVSAGWNDGLSHLFERKEVQQVLTIGSDTVLPEWFYAELLSYDVPFVTGISVNSMEAIAKPPQRMPLNNNPDFSGFMIRREAWEKVGRFDERMMMYASDLDYHLRAWMAGVEMKGANVPFYHERSSTIRNATPDERRVIECQAEVDRKIFSEKWGVPVLTSAYEALFSVDSFGSLAK